jgi:twinkle protein
LTIFSGRTGQGKTTFLSEYSLDLCMQNVTTLWGSFEVKNSRLAKMQLKQFSGVNLEENLDSFDKWADLFQKMPMFYMTFFGANEVSSSTYLVFTYLRK